MKFDSIQVQLGERTHILECGNLELWLLNMNT